MDNRKDIKYLYYKLKQEFFLTKLNKVLCKPIIESDKVMFYVDNHYLTKQIKKAEEYNFEFYSLNKENDNFEKMKNLFEYYQLNKPFYYIIDGMIFEKKVIVSSKKPSTVVFRNCTFKQEIEIKNCDKLILNNNRYYCRGSYSLLNNYNKFLFGKKINEITFINESFSNKDYSHHPTPNFGINIETERINIINTNIDADSSTIIGEKVYNLDTKGEIIIKSKELNIYNSIIKSPNIYLESNNIKKDKNSTIEASQCIIIENKNENMKLNNIKTPYLIYNNKEEGTISINKLSEIFKSIIYKTKYTNKKLLKKFLKK